VRFLVVGGLAVNAHGLLRFTKDVGIVVELVPESITRAFGALETIGYRAVIPITANDFSDAELRSRLAREKNMKVLQFWSDRHPETSLDVFVTCLFDFDDEYEKAGRKPLAESGAVAYVTLAPLIAMKREAGRERDLITFRSLSSE